MSYVATEFGQSLGVPEGDFPYYLSRDAVFQSDFYGERERPAVNVAAQWAPDDRQEYTFEFFYDGFRNDTFNSLLFTFVDWWGNLGDDPGSTFTLIDGTNIIDTRTVGQPYNFNSGDLTKNKTDSYVYAVNGKWEIGDSLQLEADLAYQDSKFESQFFAMRTDRVADQVTFTVNDGDGIAAFAFGDNSVLTDPSIWNIAELYDNANSSEGDAITFTLDGDYSLSPDGSGFLENMQFGVRFDDRGASDAFRQQTGDILGQPLSSLPAEALFTNDGFFDGRSDVPTSWVLADGEYISENADTFRDLYGLPTSDQLMLNTSFNIDEQTSSAYLMFDYGTELFGRELSGQAGLRWIRVNTDTTFFQTQVAGMPSESASTRTQDLLPSFTVNYDIFDDVRLRFNYGETLRRPGFPDLNPTLIYNDDVTDVGYGTASGGNPDLAPTTSKNFDLAAEWYFEPDSAFYATLFRREIDGLVVPFRFPVQADIPGFDANTFIVSAPANASDGILKGVEVGLTYFPDFLPSVLDGLGFQGSLTYLDSSQNIPQTDASGAIVGQEESAFFGVSDWSYNATLAYENGPVGMRLSYVWRDDFLQRNEAALFANPLGVYRDSEKSLDLQLSYDLTENATLTFDAVNLTDELQQEYYQFADAGGPDTHNFGSVILSRTFAFGLRFGF